MVIAPARRAGDPGSNPGPGENFFILFIILRMEVCKFIFNKVFQLILFYFQFLKITFIVFW